MNCALLVIDMQKCFIAEYREPNGVKECCEYINYTASLLRKAGQTVIHIQDVEEADEVGPEMIEFVDEITVEPSDLRVKKLQSNAFWETDLESIIQERKIDLLILAGQAAEFCVVFTYNGAWERGHKAVILQNGVVSQKPDRVAHLYADRHLISYPVIQQLTKR